MLTYLDESTRLTITASLILISYFRNMVTIYLQHSAVAMVVYNTNVIFNVRINHILLYCLNSNMLIFLIGQNFSLVQLQSLYIQAYLCISLYRKYKKNIQITQFIPLIYFIFCCSCSLNMVLEFRTTFLQPSICFVHHYAFVLIVVQ